MKNRLTAFLLVSTLISAAEPVRKPRNAAVSDRHSTRNAGNFLDGPALGFLQPAGTADALIPILGLPGASYTGSPVRFGEDVTAVTPSPRHDYVVVESSGRVCLAIAEGPAVRDPECLPGVDGSPSLLSLSPTGRSMAVYFEPERRLQIWSNLPDAPALAADIALDHAPRRMAVSDDGARVQYSAAGGDVYVQTPGEPPVFLYRAEEPPPAEFLANRHDFAIADASQAAVTVFPDADASRAHRIAHGLDFSSGPVFLRSSPGGESLLVTWAGSNILFRISTASGSREELELPAPAECLEPLAPSGFFLVTRSLREPLWLLDASSAVARHYFTPAYKPAPAGERR